MVQVIFTAFLRISRKKNKKTKFSLISYFYFILLFLWAIFTHPYGYFLPIPMGKIYP